jgi:TonB-linked SusC/RagA family outer membrane protein
MTKLYIKQLSFIFLFSLSVVARLSATQLISMEQLGDTDLIGVLEQLREENDIFIIYEPALVRGLKIDPIALDGKQGIEATLTALLTQVGLDFQILKENTYAIVKAGKNAQDITVSGKVISLEDNSAIPGVTVVIKGTETGVITDLDGNYTINLPSSESVLIFSFIGFVSVERKVGNKTTLNIEMELDVKQLSEVVITAIGIESDKRELGYSIQNVDTDDLLKSRETNISSALSAKVAGVQVISSSGSPGAAATVRIRGNRTANGSNEPLYVIDGVPISNSTSGNGIIGVDVSNRAIDINPNDIEKVTVLKGPSATVLYGSRAANGAIMINTKRGKVGAPVITYNASYGISEVTRLPPRQNEYAQGSPVAGKWTYRGPETTESLSWGPAISELEYDGDSTYLYDRNGRLVPTGTGNGIPAKGYDVYDAFWVKGKTVDNNISVNGGTEAVRYYFSIGHLYQSGVVPNADFTRTSVKSNIDATITPKLGAGISATYIHSGGNRAQRGSNLSGVTTGVFRNPPTFDIGNGKTGNAAADSPDAYIFPNGNQRSYRGNGLFDNPFWSVNRNPYIDNVDRVMGNINLNYKVFDWLKTTYKLGLDQYTDRRNLAWDINSSSEPLGKVDQSTSFSNIINSDFLVIMSQQMGDFGLDLTLGHNYFYSKSFSRASEGNIMAVQGFYNISNAQQVITTESYNSREKFFGAFADFRLNYREYLFLSFSGRNDWSSTLPRENNSFFYPAASLGLEFTELFGFSDSRIFPYGKLRVSYGQVGTGGPSFRTDNYYSNASIDGDGLLSANEFPAFGINAFERSGLLANKNLKPELTTTLELGGDFQFFDSRVGLDLTYYKAFTNNQIVTTTVSAATGYTTLTLNSGEIENKGLEVVLNTAPIRNSVVNWDLDFTFTRNRSIIKSLPEDVESITLAEFTAISSVNLVGQPYGVFSGTRYKRNEAGKMVIGSDGWPLLSESQGIIGNPNPDWFAGVKNSVSAYGFSLSMLWDIKHGGDVWNGTKAVMDYLGTSKESGDQRDVTGYIYDGVTVDGEVNAVPVDFASPTKGLSGIKWRKAGTLLGVAEDNIEDASWIRLREVTLGYDVPRKLLNEIKAIQSANLSVYGRNLLLFTEYKGVDPETNLRGPSNAQGWDYFNLPGTRSYGVSLRVVFK